MAIRLYQQFWKKNELSKFSQLLNASSRITFWTLHVRANFGFAYLMCPSVSGPKALINVSAICHFSEKLQNIFEIGLKRYRVFVQKSLSLKKIFQKKKLSDAFFVYVLIYPLSKFWGNRTNSVWVLALYSVRFKWNNWFERTALNMSIRRVYFRPKLKTTISLPIFNLFQWFLFYIRNFIWIITLTEKSKFEENCRS